MSLLLDGISFGGRPHLLFRIKIKNPEQPLPFQPTCQSPQLENTDRDQQQADHAEEGLAAQDHFDRKNQNRRQERSQAKPVEIRHEPSSLLR